MKWLADENFDNDILRGIWRRAVGFDVVRVQDVAEISGLDDPAVLEWATTNHRIVLTHDDSSDENALVRSILGERPYMQRRDETRRNRPAHSKSATR